MYCPYCNIEIFKVEVSSFLRVMDGHIVWQCPNDVTHRFFRGSMKAGSAEYIFQDPNADQVLGDRSGNCFHVEVIKTYKFTKVETTA